MELTEQQLRYRALQRRVGDYLINAGDITPQQLEDAIEHQCIYGGKLGTSLIELGLVNENKLAKILSHQLKLHYIKPKLLMNVPGEILRLVPREIALRYLVVPYAKDNKKLFLAMKDCSNLAVIDELGFMLDHIIVPLAIPEVRVMLALKEHYGFNLSPRFKHLEEKLAHRAGAIQKKPAPEQKKSEKIPDKEVEAWPLLGDEEYPDDPEADDAYFGHHTKQDKIMQTSFAQQLVEAEDRNDIAHALLNQLATEFSTCGLFTVRGDTVTGWKARNNGTEPANFDHLSIPLAEPSIFSTAVSCDTHVLGPVVDTPQNNKLLALFSTKPPQTALVMPLRVRNRLVSFLYMQDDLVLLEKRFNELDRIAHKVEMAFTLLILKNKILST